MQAAEQVLELSEELYKHNKNFAIAAVGDDEMSMINWEDANMELDQYALQVFPTSMLPHTPVGRLQFVDFLAKTLQLPPDEVYQLIDMPDVKAFRKRHLAGKDVIDRTLDEMYNGGDFYAPEPFDDLEYAVKRAQQTYDMARLHSNTPHEVLDNLQKYMKACVALLSPPPPEEPPPQDPNMGAPMPMDPNAQMAMPPMPPDDGMAGMPPVDPNMGAGMPPAPEPQM